MDRKVKCGNSDFFGSGFALLVVLFILLIIIGTSYTGNAGGYGCCGY